MGKKQQLQYLRLATHIGALIPLAFMGWLIASGNLSADPLRELTFRTGKTAIILLTLSLACTPLSILGWKVVLPLRKPLGLYAFGYATLHFGIFIFSYGYFGDHIAWGAVWQEATQRRYAIVGLAAFILLIPLAATSFNWAMRKLGKRWKPLHRLVYLIAILVIIHYYWLVKGDYAEPILFTIILAILFAIRLPPIKNKITAWHKARRKRARTSA